MSTILSKHLKKVEQIKKNGIIYKKIQGVNKCFLQDQMNMRHVEYLP